jgi:enoyl-CoA hydratase
MSATSTEHQAAAELVHYTVDRAVARITLDSPHNRNALSTGLVSQLSTRLGQAGADDAVRAVVLTHTGGTFCAGADLTEARAGSMTQGADGLVGLLRAVVELPKPVVCRVAGHVRAGGMGLVGACDLAIAGMGATFAFTEIRLGLAPAVISLTCLPRMPERAASRYLLTGEVFDASTAAQIGLVTEATDDLDAALAGILDGLRAASPQGLRETKPLTTRTVRRALAEQAAELAGLSGRLFASEEAREGMQSFLERRPPRWAIRTETPEETP